MRIRVGGTATPVVAAVSSGLMLAGFALAGRWPTYEIFLDEWQDGGKDVLIDSVDGQLDDLVVRHLRVLTSASILLMTAGGNESEHIMRIVLPKDDDVRHAVERALVRAFLDLRSARVPRPWWRFTWR